ncbi:hypothetical protein C8R44DRAFT_796375 [Mycena epipterygia]|nr:hypothetical protein C8R44DRAFT_796375 [Mycena epipterygia]
MLQGSQISSFSVERNNSFLSEAPLRWDQLTVLSIKGPPSSVTSHMALEIISRCRALRNCAVMVDDHEGLVETQSAHAVVELSFLHTLELSCWGMTTHASLQFLTHLLLPELRNFTLRGYITLSDDGAYPPSLNHFFATPKHLESVSISNTFSKSHLVEMLHSLPPSVQRLQIEETHLFSLDDDGLALLTPAPGRPSLSCPALRELVIYQCRSTSDAAVLQFIAARMAVTPCPTLKRVEVQFARERTLDILPPLRPFIETGELTVAITHLRPFPPQFSPWQGLSDAPANSPPGPWAYDYNDQGFDWDT